MANKFLMHFDLGANGGAFFQTIRTLIDQREFGFSVAFSLSPFGLGQLALGLEAPALFICLGEEQFLCGPLLQPGLSVCPDCLEHWLTTNYHNWPAERSNLYIDLAEVVVTTLLECAVRFEAEGVVEELTRGLVAHSYLDGTRSWHPLYPRRGCPRCGDLAEGVKPPMSIHCSRWTGIVHPVEVTAAPVAGAYRARAMWSAPLPVNERRPLLLRQSAYGRGRTVEEARTGCMGEALERYSLIYRGDEQLIRAAFRELDALPPNDILLYSEAQYQSRTEWNALADENFFVGAPFDPERPVDWLEARGLGRAPGSKFVPAGCCLMWYPFRPDEPEYARADTIGCGGGESLDDALAHGLLEWVERDAMAIWWDNRLRRPALRLESFESKELLLIAEGLRAIGRDLFLLDCTTDTGIPAYVSVAPRFDGSEPLFAGAAHRSPRVAAYKAASEVGQVWFEARRSGSLPLCLRDWLLLETTATQPYLAPFGIVDAPREPEPAPGPIWMPMVERLEAAGLSAYAVDHSRPDVVSHTVRAIVPGLRHIWNRRGPGRLYEVPVRMGWLPRANTEEEMNPIRCMV